MSCCCAAGSGAALGCPTPQAPHLRSRGVTLIIVAEALVTRQDAAGRGRFRGEAGP